MKILCIHPQDEPALGSWAKLSWDRVLDLGMGGSETYERWAGFFHCPVESLGFSRTRHELVKDALSYLSGHLLDSQGIDWWEILSVQYIQRLYRIAALQEVADTIDPYDSVFFTRACFEARAFGVLLGRAVSVCASEFGALSSVSRHYRKLARLSGSQVRQVISDKYDPKHRIRARVTPKRTPCEAPVILLPTAYVNVTRTALAYVRVFPNRQFLLVVGRHSGRANELPPNVTQANLSAYVSNNFDHDEYIALCRHWAGLSDRLESEPLLHVLLKAGALESFTKDLSHWLAIRNAWLEVFETEPIEAVFSCDENNPYTAIPLLIAKQRGISSVASHHGALDGCRLLTSSRADVLLAKGPMEHDYLLSVCGVPRDRLEIGAPDQEIPNGRGHLRSSIVFFSEDYEVSGGRAEEFYRDVLPPLTRLAVKSNKTLIIKVHPAESAQDRRRIVNRILSDGGAGRVRVLDGPLTDDLMKKEVWFAITVISTTAMDCALRGIPVFLCGWLENWPFKYSEQFAKFRVGTRLSGPEQIEQIPELLCDYEVCNPRDLWQPIQERLLQKIFTSNSPELTTAT